MSTLSHLREAFKGADAKTLATLLDAIKDVKGNFTSLKDLVTTSPITPINLGTPGKRPLNVGGGTSLVNPEDAQLGAYGKQPLNFPITGIAPIPKRDLFGAQSSDWDTEAQKAAIEEERQSSLMAMAGMTAPVKGIGASKKVLNVAKLGRVVPPEGFRSGWIMPDGTLRQLTSDAPIHSSSVAKALGITEKAGVNALPKAANEAGAIRAYAPKVGFGKPQPGDLAAEVFSAPSDSQIRALRNLEQLHETSVSFDLSHPQDGNIMGTGYGVNKIRGAIQDAEMQHGGLWTGETIPAKGAEITKPSKSYQDGATDKPIDTHTGEGGNNVWVRQHDKALNKDRTLMMQFSNRTINPRSGQPSDTEQYFDKLYNTRKGYKRPDDFWEIPQWQANMSHNLPNVDSYIVRDPAEAAQFLKRAGYGNVAMSALDANKDLVHGLAEAVPNQKFSIGGYTDFNAFNDLPNVKTYKSMPDFINEQPTSGGYKDGYDYRLFSGTPTVPRLTMSTGCLHSCAFCSMPRDVVANSRESVMQQADAIAKDLPSNLVYLNDKTFGQAKNYTMLPEVFDKIKAKTPDFGGFIIQTTAAQMKKMPVEFLKDAGIKQVELGIESYNDPILKAMKKPANRQLIDEAATKLRSANIELIPNVMVGLPGETKESYANTMRWLNDNSDIISHVNVNNLAVYKDAELAHLLKPANASDLNENIVERSWHEDPAIHTGFYNDASRFGSGQLDKIPFQNVTPNPAPQVGGAPIAARPPAPVSPFANVVPPLPPLPPLPPPPPPVQPPAPMMAMAAGQQTAPVLPQAPTLRDFLNPPKFGMGQ